MRFRIISEAFLILFLLFHSVFAEDVTFQGKVIDAETFKPIEGAVVVAIWNKSRAGMAGSDTVFHDAKKALTDKNGDWVITGPKGRSEDYNRDHNRIISFIFWKHYLMNPYFIIYKPGYLGIPTSLKHISLQAFPFVKEEQNIEGIVLIYYEGTRKGLKTFSEKYQFEFPFIPIKDPERKLRNLDFSFKYPESAMKVSKVQPKEKLPYQVYTIDGLTKAKTREERRIAIPVTPKDGVEKTPLLNKILLEEDKFLYERRKAN